MEANKRGCSSYCSIASRNKREGTYGQYYEGEIENLQTRNEYSHIRCTWALSLNQLLSLCCYILLSDIDYIINHFSCFAFIPKKPFRHPVKPSDSFWTVCMYIRYLGSMFDCCMDKLLIICYCSSLSISLQLIRKNWYLICGKGI